MPTRVDSDSMAPRLLGPHQRVVCRDCGHAYRSEANPLAHANQSVCTNCGYSNSPTEELLGLAGDGLLVDRSAYQWRGPRRWEIASFRHPHLAGRLCVKRVVGLPGERIEIRHGQVYVDGQIQRKTLAQQRAMAVLVHDADHPPTCAPTPPPRWLAANASSRWGRHGGRFAHALASDQRHFDWLAYRHWRRLPNRPGQDEVVMVHSAEIGSSFGRLRPEQCAFTLASEGDGPREWLLEIGPVNDADGYNSTQPRRIEEVAPVRDLLLSFSLVQAWGDGMLAVRMTDGDEEFEFRWTPATGQYRVLIDGEAPGNGAGRLPKPVGRAHFEFSMIDRQYLVAVDRLVVGTWPREPETGRIPSTPEPFRIGARRLGAVIEQLRVYRDVYYSRPTGIKARWGFDQPVSLGRDEYYVLGDNSPGSDDSRTWAGGPGVAAAFLLGRPLLMHSPARRIRLGPLELQVPDPARIRYVR